MLDRWYKIAAIVASLVVITSAVVGPSIAGLIWAIRVDFDVVDLRSDVADLQTDVSDLQTDVADLRTDVSDLQTDVADLQTDVADLQTDVDHIRADVAEIKETQKLILESVNRMETALITHTHDADGRAQVARKE